MIYSMTLAPQPFDMIKSGEKTIELRLYDEKRSRIQVGDTIRFTCSGSALWAQVVRLHRFDSFQRLYRQLPLLKCGYTPDTIHAASYRDMEEYYTPEQQARYGVVGIELSLLNVTPVLSENDPQTPEIAAQIIRSGGLVAIPTETVYGLGANGLDENAVAKIFEAKGRPQDNPLILHISGPEQMELFCHHIPPAAYDLAKVFWPGPLTMVLPAKAIVPKRTTAGLSTVAVRCPDNDVTRQIIRLAGVPIAAPSANLSGKPSTTTAQHVLHDHDGKIHAIVDGGPCRVGVESTIVDLTEDRPRLLRPGGVTPEALLKVLGDLVVDKAVTAQIDRDTVVKAPGMKYRHYAPVCPVVIVSGSREKAAAYIHRHFEAGDRVLCFTEELPLYEGCHPLAYGSEADVNTLSAGLFGALRELDDPRIRRVYARCPEGGGVAYAVQNRLKKAAAFHIVDGEADE